MKTGKLAIFKETNKPFEIIEKPLTVPKPGMAQMELIASGICGTDLHIWTGRLPFPTPQNIGHEFIGRITELSPADSARSGLQTGDAVEVFIACPCGECKLCRQGDGANCLHMGVTNGGNPYEEPYFHGGFGEYSYAPVENLYKIPASLNPKTVSVYACAGPTVLHGIKLISQAGVNPAACTTAVVQGVGPVGCFAILYLSSLGIKNVIAVARRNEPKRNGIIRELGATEILSTAELGEEGVIRRVREVSGIGADLVVECSGNPRAVKQGLPMLRNRGTYLIPGQYSNSGPVEIEPQMITFGALRIIGSSQFDGNDIRTYIGFLEAHPELHGKIDALLTEYTVENVNQAMADAAAGKNIKSILVKE